MTLRNYTTVPAGRYVCRIAEVRTDTTRAGDRRWAVRLVVDRGPEAGRTAAWDGLIFSARGLPRVRRILGVLGLPAPAGPDALLGRAADVEVRHVEVPVSGGEVLRRNEVPYDGWRRAGDGSCPACGSACWAADPETGGAVCESCGFLPEEGRADG